MVLCSTRICYRILSINEPRVLAETTARPDPLGIPAAFAFLLVRQRVSLNPPTDKRLEANRGRENVVVRKPLWSTTYCANIQDIVSLSVRL